MTSHLEYPPAESALQELWGYGDIQVRINPKVPVRLDSSLIVPLLGARLRWHFSTDTYVRHMEVVSELAVADTTDYYSNKRRFTFIGRAAEGVATPQLAFDLARDEGGLMVGCAVSILPGSMDEQGVTPTEHRVADIPLAVFAADRAGTLTPEFAEGAQLPQVRALALTAGATIMNAVIRG